MTDTITNGRTHPRPRQGDKASFIYQKTGESFGGEIFIDNMRRVLFGFDAPKIGVRNELDWIPYKRVVVLGENACIKEPILWYDAQDFILTERAGKKIYYPGEEIEIPEFNRTFKIIEVTGDIIVCCSKGVCLTFEQPSLQTSD